MKVNGDGSAVVDLSTGVKSSIFKGTGVPHVQKPKVRKKK